MVTERRRGNRFNGMFPEWVQTHYRYAIEEAS